MYLRKKYRTRLFIFLAILLAIIFWRGIKATTQGMFDCDFKIIYAVCTANSQDAEMPSLWQIIKAGVKFN